MNNKITTIGVIIILVLLTTAYWLDAHGIGLYHSNLSIIPETFATCVMIWMLRDHLWVAMIFAVLFVIIIYAENSIFILNGQLGNWLMKNLTSNS